MANESYEIARNTEINAEITKLRRQVNDLTEKAILGQAMREEGERKLTLAKEQMVSAQGQVALAKLYSELADISFLSPQNRRSYLNS